MDGEDKKTETLTTIKIGEKEVEVSNDVAKVFSELNNEYISSLKTKDDQIGSLNTQITDFKTPKKEVKDTIDRDADFLEHPTDTFDKLLSERDDNLRNELKIEKDKEDGVKIYWKNFDEKFPELKDNNDIVRMVMTKNWNDLKDLSIEQSIEKLGAAAKLRLITLMKQPAVENENSTNLESGMVLPDFGSSVKEPEKKVTMTSVLANRKEARAKAASGFVPVK